MMLGIFDDLDVNGDGVISRETLAAYLGEVAAVPRSPPRAGGRSQPAVQWLHWPVRSRSE